MSKPRDNKSKNSATATKKPDKLFGQPTIKDGSAVATKPEEKHPNDMIFDYASLEYKKYPNKVKINIELDEERFPAESKVPAYKKYDEKGNYIKNKFIATEKKQASDDKFKYSLGQLTREHALSNPVKNKYGRKR